jgi:LemA protein
MIIVEAMVLTVLLFVVIGGIGYVLSLYNGLVSVRTNIARAWSNIDVLLKQRHDELPKLIKVCEGYMQHERAVFDKLSEARSLLAKAQTVGERAGAENMLTRALGGIFAVAEAYPDLKANVAFSQLQTRISDIENQIADRREFYNDVVTTWNTRIQQIPDMYVASWLAAQPAELFKVAESDREDVAISFKLTG